MPIYKQQKIDLREIYPCPCCRGNLQQIILTEALGCDRCQKIFALWKDGYVIEQTSSPYHNCWRWDGKRWQTKNPASQSSWILFGGLVLTAAFAVGALHLLSRSSEKTPIAPHTPKISKKSPISHKQAYSDFLTGRATRETGGLDGLLAGGDSEVANLLAPALGSYKSK